MNRQDLDAFGEQYGYDVSYMREFLKASPELFGRFTDVLPWVEPSNHVPIEVSAVAKIATMQAEDCGPCLELTVKLAIESGVAREWIRAALDGGDDLEGACRDAYVLARRVARNEMGDDAVAAGERLRAQFGAAGVAELALCIAGSRVFPSIKRAIGHHATSCSRIRVDVGALA